MAIKFNKLTTVLALASVVTSLLPVAASAAELMFTHHAKKH